jgi:membrane-associated phospholipid phosphatase
MFQTWPNLALQSLMSDAMTSIMWRVSDMGYEPFLAGVVAVLMFGVHFRRGFLVLQLLLWSALVNSALKSWLALPRPVHVDSRVVDIANGATSPFTDMGARTFFGGIPDEVVRHVRSVIRPGSDEFGFPSGHVQSTAALWGAVGILWDQRLILKLAPVVVLLMAVSRMYLGRHFLGDVVGGAIVGVLLLTAFVAARRTAWDEVLFQPDTTALRAAAPNAAAWLFLVGAPLAALYALPERAGMMLGVNAGFLLVVRRGLPDYLGTLPQRAGRVAIALVIFALSRVVVTLLAGAAQAPEHLWWLNALETFVPGFLMLWGTVTASTRAKLYQAPEPSASPRRKR